MRLNSLNMSGNIFINIIVIMLDAFIIVFAFSVLLIGIILDIAMNIITSLITLFKKRAS